MRSVEEQLDYVLKRVSPLEPFPIGLLDARGCVVAEDITAPWPLPAFDTAATDGYAVRVNDVLMASASHPVTLDVVDTIAVGGRPGKALIPGVAIRVSAGAALPEETEAVVPVEYTDGGAPLVTIHKGSSFGQYIRRTGEDVELGEVVVPIALPLMRGCLVFWLRSVAVKSMHVRDHAWSSSVSVQNCSRPVVASNRVGCPIRMA